MDQSVSVRPASPADLDAIADLMGLAFHDPLSDEQRELEVMITEVERSLVADDGGLIVGHASAQTRELTVPGAVVAAAHVTGVGVAPTHRRRGLLSTMMRRQLGEIAAAGREPLAILWASEGGIYQRYGYGAAAVRLKLEMRSREVALTPPPGTSPGWLRLVRPKEVQPDLVRAHERLRGERLGWSSRPDYWWRYLLADPESRRGGATEMRGVLCEGPDGPLGYALYRVKERWGDYGPDSQVRVAEVVAADPATYAQLWGFLSSLDLTRWVSYHYAAVDEPLQHLVGDARQLGRSVADSLWVRLVDLPAALEARRYSAPLDVVLEVTDPIVEGNSGRWRLTGDQGKASCARTTDAPDLSCSITELGAAYLGAVPMAALAFAGRLRQHTDNLPGAAFGWHRAPQALEVF